MNSTEKCQLLIIVNVGQSQSKAPPAKITTSDEHHLTLHRVELEKKLFAWYLQHFVEMLLDCRVLSDRLAGLKRSHGKHQTSLGRLLNAPTID